MADTVNRVAEQPYKRTSPLKIRQDRNSIVLDLQSRMEHDQYPKVSPPVPMPKPRQPKGRKAPSIGIVTGIRQDDSPV